MYEIQAKLVIKDQVEKILRQAPSTGCLLLNVKARIITFTYKYNGNQYIQKYNRPSKCMIGKTITRIYSYHKKKFFMIMITNARDIMEFIQILKQMQTEVIVINPEIPKNTSIKEIQEHRTLALYSEEMNQILMMLQDPNQAPVLKKCMQSYIHSRQYPLDRSSILESLFMK